MATARTLTTTKTLATTGQDGGGNPISDALDQWASSVGARLTLQADLTWGAIQDGYVDAGTGDAGSPYSQIWWTLEPGAKHCFPAGTQIATPNGDRSIETIQVGDLVQTPMGPRCVTRLFHHVHRGPLLRIGADNHEVTCTPNHPFLTQRGWVVAEDLLLGDQVMLSQDGSYVRSRHVRLPDAYNGVTTRSQVGILSAVASLLRHLTFSQRREARMAMPIVAIGLNDQCPDAHVNHVDVSASHATEAAHRSTTPMFVERLAALFTDKLHHHNDVSSILCPIMAQRGTVVYNFSVEEVEQYIANGFVVHNCSDCPDMAAGSPYDPPGSGGNELDQTPGDGRTECGAACKCDLSYQPPDPENWVSWSDIFPPDMPQMQQLAPPSGPSGPSGDGQTGQSATPSAGAHGNGASGDNGAPQYSRDVLQPQPTAKDAPLTTDQKAALDAFRSAWTTWDAVRGAYAAVPSLFASNDDYAEGALEALSPQSWVDLTPQQQRAFVALFEALVAWDVATKAANQRGGQLAEPLDDTVVRLFNPNHDARGRFAPGSGGRSAEESAREARGSQHGTNTRTSRAATGNGGRRSRIEHVDGGDENGEMATRGASGARRSRAQRDTRTPEQRRADTTQQTAAKRLATAQERLERAASDYSTAEQRANDMRYQKHPAIKAAQRDIMRQAADRMAPTPAYTRARDRMDAAKAAHEDALASERAARMELQRAHDEAVARGIAHPESNPTSEYARASRAADRAGTNVMRAELRYQDAATQFDRYAERLAGRPSDEVVNAHPLMRQYEHDVAEAHVAREETRTRYETAQREVDRAQVTYERAAARKDAAYGGPGVIVRYGDRRAESAVQRTLGDQATTTTLAKFTNAKAGDVIEVRSGLVDTSFGIDARTSESEAHMTVQRISTPEMAAEYGVHEGALVVSDTYVRSAGKTERSGETVIRSFAGLRDIGVERVYATAMRSAGAHGFNGYETWAHMGAHGPIPDHLLPSAQRKFGGGVTRVEQLMGTREGRAWWRSNGDSWSATMDLTPGGATRAYIDRLERRLNQR